MTNLFAWSKCLDVRSASSAFCIVVARQEHFEATPSSPVIALKFVFYRNISENRPAFQNFFSVTV